MVVVTVLWLLAAPASDEASFAKHLRRDLSDLQVYEGSGGQYSSCLAVLQSRMCHTTLAQDHCPETCRRLSVDTHHARQLSKHHSSPPPPSPPPPQHSTSDGGACSSGDQCESGHCCQRCTGRTEAGVSTGCSSFTCYPEIKVNLGYDEYEPYEADQTYDHGPLGPDGSQTCI